MVRVIFSLSVHVFGADVCIFVSDVHVFGADVCVLGVSVHVLTILLLFISKLTHENDEMNGFSATALFYGLSARNRQLTALSVYGLLSMVYS